MTRWWIGALLLAGLVWAAPAQEPQYEEPAEEDEALVRPTEYAFNPLQAQKELRIGDFYWKKKSYQAAAGRYEEATKWNPGLAEAYWKRALAEERLADDEAEEVKRGLHVEAAVAALKRYLELEDSGKRARDATKKLAELSRR